MNAAVAAYQATVENLARQFVGWNGAETDDLVQEGLILVWLSLRRGICPSAAMIENRMRDWADLLNRQNPIPYDEMLPLDEYKTSNGDRRVSPVDAHIAARDE